jgi:hypothetical protein
MSLSGAHAHDATSRQCHASSSHAWVCQRRRRQSPLSRRLCCCLCRYEPDAAFKRISITQPKLDLSEVGVGGDQELWLLQLPHDVRLCACLMRHAVCMQGCCSSRAHHPGLLPAVPHGRQSELDDQGGCGGRLPRPLQHPG